MIRLHNGQKRQISTKIPCLSRARPVPSGRYKCSHASNDEHDWNDPTRERCVVSLQVNQSHKPSRSKALAQGQPQQVDLQPTPGSRRLSAQHDEAYTSETPAPANIGEESSTYPDEKKAPAAALNGLINSNISHSDTSFLRSVLSKPNFIIKMTPTRYCENSLPGR